MAQHTHPGGPVLATAPSGPVEEDPIRCVLPGIEIDVQPVAIQTRPPENVIDVFPREKGPGRPQPVSVEVKRETNVQQSPTPRTPEHSGKTSKFRIWSAARPHMRAFHFGMCTYM